jgi:hypothetical protein
MEDPPQTQDGEENTGPLIIFDKVLPQILGVDTVARRFTPNTH